MVDVSLRGYNLVIFPWEETSVIYDRSGPKVRRARERAGMTQAEAAKRMPGRVSAAYWSGVENGHRRASLEWLWDAASALGCNPRDLDERLAAREMADVSLEGNTDWDGYDG